MRASLLSRVFTAALFSSSKQVFVNEKYFYIKVEWCLRSPYTEAHASERQDDDDERHFDNENSSKKSRMTRREEMCW